MFLWLLDYLARAWPSAVGAGELAAMGKITFRASLAAMPAFALALVLGPRLIRWLRARFPEPIKSDSPRIRQLHRPKQATPTMGGLFLVAGLAAVLVYRHHLGVADGLALRLPWAETPFSLGVWFVPLAVVVIVGFSNAVNLTDGLDGLAGGCLIFAAGAMALVAYASGHAELADYLSLPRLAGVGEMTIVGGAMIGGLLGFLWFNCHPAQVFMGDTGSLPLGGLLGLLAVVARQEFLLLLVGGVFVVEAASVVLQVGYYKWRRRRIFLCAPLHHHFQFLGWPESRIVVRFWIGAAVCAILGLAALKLGAGDDRPGAPGSGTTVEMLANQ